MKKLNSKSKFSDLALKVKLSADEIKKLKFNQSYWESNALKFKSQHTASWGDVNMMSLEIKNISLFLDEGDHVLDAGCSNGYSTFEIAKNKSIKMRAFDYSEKSIFHAKRVQKIKDKKKQIIFYHGNILNIDELDNSFDKVYTIRVLINLLSWKLQKQAIIEVYRVLKKGGLFLMSESFSGSLANINKLRALGGFSLLVMHDFNLYLNEKRIEKFLKKYFVIEKIIKFSSIYYVASRFMRYLTMRSTDRDSFQNEFNNNFTKYEPTESSGDFGIQKLYVLRKK